jgi:lipoate synthase
MPIGMFTTYESELVTQAVNKSVLIEHVTSVISDNLGNEAARLYREYYQSIDSRHVLASIEALLKDLVGENNAKKQLCTLFEKLKMAKERTYVKT